MNHQSNTKREDIERLLKQAQFEAKFKQNKNVEQLNETISPPVGRNPVSNKHTIISAIKRDQLSTNKRKLLEENIAFNAVRGLKEFLLPSKNWYLNFGGTGDLILLLACCHEDPNAQVAFFANTGSMNFCKEFLQFFRLDNYVARDLMGSKNANVVYDYMIKKINFKSSGHLAKGLDYGDWGRDINYYKQRMVFKTNWREKFGKHPHFENQKTIIIQPSGSVRDSNRQRYLEVFEYDCLVNKYLGLGYNVITTGSDGDKEFYKWKPNRENNWFLTSNRMTGNKSSTPIDLSIFLKILHSVEKVISADTWLKSYSLLCGIPTIVFNNRCRGRYLPIGSDPCDHIFLNKDLWQNLEVKTVEEIVMMD